MGSEILQAIELCRTYHQTMQEHEEFLKNASASFQSILHAANEHLRQVSSIDKVAKSSSAKAEEYLSGALQHVGQLRELDVRVQSTTNVMKAYCCSAFEMQ